MVFERRNTPLIALIGAFLLLAACSDGDGSANSASTTSRPTTTAKPAPTTTIAETSVQLVISSGPYGEILMDSDYRSLYRFQLEDKGTITCYEAPCVASWPPVILTADAPLPGGGIGPEMGAVTRPDGTRQLTFRGWPLYRFRGDLKPGTANGDGVGGVWHVIRPTTPPATGPDG
jgi:predicted lipoprotein with Yx(FWY)xxD motif